MFPYRKKNIEVFQTFPIATRLRVNPFLPLLLALLLLCSCAKSSNRSLDMVFSGRTFVSTGEVVHMDLREKRLQIAHGNIEGFMEAMTMWFETEEPASNILKNLKRGDKVRFELKEVTNGPSLIFKIYILH